ncbi:MAG: hypothetical protein R2698_09880 [Microthrixaceae bacterium]
MELLLQQPGMNLAIDGDGLLWVTDWVDAAEALDARVGWLAEFADLIPAHVWQRVGR